RGEDRPRVRPGHGDRSGRPRDRTGGGGPVPALRPDRGGRGGGERADPEPAGGDRLRHRPGLPVQPAALVRPAGGMVPRPRRAGAGGGVGGGGGTAAACRTVTGARIPGFANDGVVVYSYPGAPSAEVQAPLAQSAERLHGKEKVYGSIP